MSSRTSLRPEALPLRSLFRPDGAPEHAEGRGAERYRRALLTAITLGGARGLSFVSFLVVVPIGLHSLGTREFGVFTTVTSVTALLTFMDLGLGNGLVNVLTRVMGADDQTAAQRNISSAAALMLSLAALFALVLSVVYRFVPWSALFNAGDSRSGQIAPAALVVGAGMIASLPLGVIQRVQIANQDGFWISFTTAISAVLTTGGVALAAVAGAGLLGFVAAVSAATPVAMFIVGCLYLGRRTQLRPRLSMARRSDARALFGIGSMFLLLQIAVVVAYQSDALVLAHILGPSAVADYAVPMRLFTLVPLLVGLVITPLWPAYGEAVARGDHEWVRMAFRRSLIMSAAVAIPLALVLGAIARPLVHAWAGVGVVPGTALLLALVAWAVVITLSTPISTFLNGTGVIGPQAIAAVAMMLANLGLSIALTFYAGVSGVVWGTVIAQLVFVGVPSAIFVKRRLRSLDGGRDGGNTTRIDLRPAS